MLSRCAALRDSFLVSVELQAWCRWDLFSLTTYSIIMVCKAVLTFLVIGALSVNVSTIPISRKPSPVQSTSEVDTPMSMPLTPPYSNTNTNPGTPILPSDKIFRKPESSPLAGHDSPNVLSTSGGAPGAPNPSTDPKASPDPNTPNDPKTSKGWGEFSRKTGEFS